MKRSDAETIKAKYSQKHQYEASYEFFSAEQITGLLKVLAAVQQQFELKISDFSLESTCDLLDDETPQIIRVFWFSRGLRDYYVCVDGNGTIRMTDSQMPPRLLKQVQVILIHLIKS